MDTQLAAYFATMRAGRDGKRARQDMINFKLRALACLESYIKRVPESPLLVTMPAPLLGALSSASKSGEDRVLADRIAGLFRNHLARSRARVTKIHAAVEMQAQLRRALYLASRSDDRIVADAAAAAYTFLQGAAQGNEVEGVTAAARDSAEVAVADFFNKKSRLGRGFLQQLFRRVPEVARASLPSLMASCAGARNEYLKQEAFWLVATAATVSTIPASIINWNCIPWNEF